MLLWRKMDTLLLYFQNKRFFGPKPLYQEFIL